MQLNRLTKSTKLLQQVIKSHFLEHNAMVTMSKRAIHIAELMKQYNKSVPTSLDLESPENHEEFKKFRNECTKFVSKLSKRVQV